jgi:hypothetical protein
MQDKEILKYYCFLLPLFTSDTFSTMKKRALRNYLLMILEETLSGKVIKHVSIGC